MARGQSRELVTLSKQKRIRSDHQSANFLLDEVCEGRVDFTFGAGVEHINPYSEGVRSVVHSTRFRQRGRKVRIDKHRKGAGLGYELTNEFQPLRPHLHRHNGRAREVAARPVETGNKSSFNWITTDSENDRYGGCRRLSCQWRRLTPGGGNHCNLTADQLGGQLRKPIVLAFCPAILDCDVLAFEIAGLSQTLAKGAQDTCRLGRRPCA